MDALDPSSPLPSGALFMYSLFISWTTFQDRPLCAGHPARSGYAKVSPALTQLTFYFAWRTKGAGCGPRHQIVWVLRP